MHSKKSAVFVHTFFKAFDRQCAIDKFVVIVEQSVVIDFGVVFLAKLTLKKGNNLGKA